MLRHVILFFLWFSIGTSSMLAQVVTAPQNDLDAKNTPPVGAPVGGLSEEAQKEKKNSDPTANSIKINPMLLGRGVAGLFYERRLIKWMAIQVGVGSMFTGDFMQANTALSDFYLTADKATIPLSTVFQNSTYSGSSIPFLAFGYRLYMDNEALRGPFFETGLRYSGYDVKLNNSFYDEDSYNYSGSTSTYIDGSRMVSIENLTIHVLLGYQAQTKGSIKTTHEFYGGIGIRNITYDGFKLTSETTQGSGGNYNTINVMRKSTIKQHASLPVLMLGYAFGFGF